MIRSSGSTEKAWYNLLESESQHSLGEGVITWGTLDNFPMTAAVAQVKNAKMAKAANGA